MKNLYGFINAREKVMRGVFLFSAIFSILALATITVFLFVSGVPFIAKTGFAKFIFGSARMENIAEKRNTPRMTFSLAFINPYRFFILL